MKISIIVGVYNSSRYLRRCLDSILAQTYIDWELLLIDDGSTDDSGRVCDEYALNDRRVRVFHKINGGIATVRQLGIEQASGEYSIHVDSDDWVEPSMLEEMCEEAVRTDADIVVADYIHEFVDKKVYRAQFAERNPLNAIEAILSGRQIGTLWNKLIRHQLYSRYNLSFAAGLDVGEDALILARLYQNPVRISYLAKAYYHYMNNGDGNSITRKRDVAKYHAVINQLEKLVQVVPPSCVSMVKHQQRLNDMQALCEGIVSVEDLRHRKVTFGFSQLFIRNIGMRVRMAALLYMLHLDYLCYHFVSAKS